MTLKLLTKEQLKLLNKKNLKYDLATAEKDYMLGVTIDIIYRSALKDRLVFKGGTAIHHCHLPQARFSEDLDFTADDKSITMKDVTDVLESFDFFEVKEKYETEKSIKINRLKYLGPLGQQNSLKIEIDRFQNVVLQPLELDYDNEWGVGIMARIMDVHEVFAEKIRASCERARYRDFYDLVLLYRRYKLSIRDAESLIRKKEIRHPVGRKYALEQFGKAVAEMEDEKQRVYYSAQINGDEIKEFINLLDFEKQPEQHDRI
jgi:predicted nucleotidyltransferase component of viral defense system